MTSEVLELFACSYIPDFDALVTTPRSYNFAIRAEGYAVDRIAMTSEGFELFACSYTPDFDAIVTAPRS